jgi:hypothetical protein
MPNVYQWATSTGDIVEAEYNETTDKLSHDDVRVELTKALELFGHTVSCEPVSDNATEEVYKATVGGDEPKTFYVCIKEMTPGGRAALKDEQRIQQQSQYINKAYDKAEAGGKAVLLGVYKRDGDVIFCAWKLKHSTADATTPISKQIKITTIADAMREGFVQQSKGSGEYACAFRKEFIFFYIRNSDWLHRILLTELTDRDETIAADSEAGEAEITYREFDEAERIPGGANYLLYGVPGSGKSHTVKTEYCDDKKRMERVVFHPDYTYSDFVGQIMPKLDEKKRVYYDFDEGPLTRILRKAYVNPQEVFYLVIEELNRGNAPAIFGEVFQLLDRKEIEPIIGESSYGITNAYVAKIVYGSPEHPVSIPSNLNLVATMNTSDQNVFTLDTAFQRRWRMRMIENDISAADHAHIQILDTSVTWEQFNVAINNLILDANTRLSSSEDKRLGVYFVTSEDLKLSPSTDAKEADKQNSRFPEKVLKYLWDDAFKFSREVVFDTENYQSLEQVIRKFKSSTGNERFTNIFREGVLGDIESEE